MPYLITTKRRQYGLVVVARHAVATLDEANIEIAARHAGSINRFAVTESGGTVTLPGGTVIEVEPTAWQDLALVAGLTFPATVGNRAEDGNEKVQSEILDAFNAKQATT